MRTTFDSTNSSINVQSPIGAGGGGGGDTPIDSPKETFSSRDKEYFENLRRCYDLDQVSLSDISERAAAAAGNKYTTTVKVQSTSGDNYKNLGSQLGSM